MENEICKLLIVNLFDDRIILRIISILLRSIKFIEPFSPTTSLRETLKVICNGLDLVYYENSGLEIFPGIRIKFSDFRDGKELKEILQKKSIFDFGNYSEEGPPWKPEKKFFNFKHNDLLSTYFEKSFKNSSKNFDTPHSLRDEILYGCILKLICDAYSADKMVSVVLVACLALDSLASEIYLDAIRLANPQAIQKINRMQFLKRVLHGRTNLDEEENVMFDDEQQEYYWIDENQQTSKKRLKKMPSNSNSTTSKCFREKYFANLTLSNSTRQNGVQAPEELRKTIVMTNEFLSIKLELNKWNSSTNCVSILLHLSNICQKAIKWF